MSVLSLASLGLALVGIREVGNSPTLGSVSPVRPTGTVLKTGA